MSKAHTISIRRINLKADDMRAGKYSKTRKLNDKTRAEIIKRFEEGTPIAQIAREYNVSWTAIKCVVDPKYYQDIKDRNKVYCKGYKRENYNNNMQRHRDYKRQLHKEGKI